MNCEDCLLALDEYIENELSEKEAVQVSAHLKSCSSCAVEYEILNRELQVYSQYLLSVEVTPASWTDLQMNIEKARHKSFSPNKPFQYLAETFGNRYFNPAVAVVTLALVIMLGVITSVIKNKSNESAFNEKIISQKNGVQSAPEKASDAENKKAGDDETKHIGNPESEITIAKTEYRGKRKMLLPAFAKPKNQSIDSGVIHRNSSPIIEDVIEKAERQYSSAMVSLASKIKRYRAQLPPDLVSQFDSSLADIDRTINETKRTVRAQPNNAVAIQYMTVAYAKKVELLRTITSGN